MIERALIQVDEDGTFPNPSLCAAFLGFRARGRDVVVRTAAEIETSTPRPEVLVFGGVEVVRQYLGRLGCEPVPWDYPDALHPYMGRSFRVETLGAIRAKYNEPGPPVFVKPVAHKLFPGQHVCRFGDLLGTAGLPPETEVYVAEHVDLLSEWRFYVWDGEAVACGHYRGDPCVFADADVVRQCVRELVQVENAPCAGSIDFGVVRGGATLLVEVNDMFSLGSYGVPAMLYSSMIEARWQQIVGST